MRTSVYLNRTGSTFGAPNLIVRSSGLSPEMALAQANSAANATGLIGVCTNAPPHLAKGLVVNVGQAAIQCDAIITPGATVYLSAATAGYGTATNTGVPIGVCLGTNTSFIMNVNLTGFAEASAVMPRVANRAALIALPTAAYRTTQSHMVEVITYGDQFRFLPAGGIAWSAVTAYVIGDRVTDSGNAYVAIAAGTNHATSDATYWEVATSSLANAIIPSTDGLGHWIRMNIRNQDWEAKQLYWSVDPQGTHSPAGSDEALGWGTTMAEADTRPLATFTEFYRRIGRVKLTANPFIHLLSDMTGTDNITPPATMTADGTNPTAMPHIYGEPTLIATRTLTDVRIGTDYVNANGKYILKCGSNWTNCVSSDVDGITGPRLVKKQGANLRAWVLTSESTTEISVSSPSTCNPLTVASAGLRGDFVIGDVVEVYSLPKVFDAGSVAVPVSLGNLWFARTGYGDAHVFSKEYLYAQCVAWADKVTFHGPNQHECCLNMNDAVYYGERTAQFRCAGLGLDKRFLYLNTIAQQLDFTCQGFRLYASSGAFLRATAGHFHDVREVLGPEPPPGLLTVDETGTILIDGQIRGRNNQAYLFSVQTPQGRIFGAGVDYVVVEVDPAWTTKVARYGWYFGESGLGKIEFAWSELPVWSMAKGTASIVDGLGITTTGSGSIGTGGYRFHGWNVSAAAVDPTDFVIAQQMHVLTDRDQTATFTNSVNLGSLTTGLLAITVTTGVATFSTTSIGSLISAGAGIRLSGTSPITITNRLFEGNSNAGAGQTIYGGTLAGEPLVINGSAHASNGPVKMTGVASGLSLDVLNGYIRTNNANTDGTWTGMSPALVIANSDSGGQSFTQWTFSGGTNRGGFRVHNTFGFNHHWAGSQGFQFYGSLDNTVPLASVGGSGVLIGGSAGAVAATHKLHVASGSIRTDGFGATGLIKNVNGGAWVLATAGTDYAVSLVPGTGISVSNSSGVWTVTNTQVGLTDGDKGDITVTSTGTVWTIDNNVVTYAKMQDTSAASRIIGRGSAGGAGDPEELTVGTGLTISGTTISSTGIVTLVAGTNVSITGTTTSTINALPAGSATQIQYNDGSNLFGAEANLTWTKGASNYLSVFGTTLDYQLRIGYDATYHFQVGRAATGSLRFYGTQAGADTYLFTGASGDKVHFASNGDVTVYNLAGTGSAPIKASSAGVLSRAGSGDYVKSITAGTNVTNGGTALDWIINVAAPVPAGAAGDVQFNSGSSTFAADGASFNYDNTNNILSVFSTTSDYQLRLGYDTPYLYQIGRKSDGSLRFYGNQAGADFYMFTGVSGDKFKIASDGTLTAYQLAGTGNRLVLATSTGVLTPVVLGTNLSFSGTTLNATGGATPAGSNTQVQYNSSGAFGASSAFTYDTSNGVRTPAFYAGTGSGIDVSREAFVADKAASFASSVGGSFDYFLINPGTTTVTGSTHNTGNQGLAAAMFIGQSFATASTIDYASTLSVFSPPVIGSGGGTVSFPFALRVHSGNTWIQGPTGIGDNWPDNTGTTKSLFKVVGGTGSGRDRIELNPGGAGYTIADNTTWSHIEVVPSVSQVARVTTPAGTSLWGAYFGSPVYTANGASGTARIATDSATVYIAGPPICSGANWSSDGVQSALYVASGRVQIFDRLSVTGTVDFDRNGGTKQISFFGVSSVGRQVSGGTTAGVIAGLVALGLFSS